MARNTDEVVTAEFNKIVEGTTIKGDIIAAGDIRIDGTITGNLNVKGKIVLGPNGRIEGDIICKNAEIQGSVNANIKAEELLSLKATARIQGEILTNKIAIEPGAKISGSINMDKQMGYLKVDKTDDGTKKEVAS